MFVTIAKNGVLNPEIVIRFRERDHIKVKQEDIEGVQRDERTLHGSLMLRLRPIQLFTPLSI